MVATECREVDQIQKNMSSPSGGRCVDRGRSSQLRTIGENTGKIRQIRGGMFAKKGVGTQWQNGLAYNG